MATEALASVVRFTPLPVVVAPLFEMDPFVKAIVLPVALSPKMDLVASEVVNLTPSAPLLLICMASRAALRIELVFELVTIKPF